MHFIAKYKPLVASLMLLATTQAHATLTSYTVNGKDVVYSSVSNVTWTKDANLLGTMFASQGFDTVVNAIIAASPTINNTPNLYSPTGTYTLSASDFYSSGQTTWFGAMAYINYLNSINYGGSNQWYLPTVANTTSGFNTSTNGTAKGDELVELFYQDLNGTARSNIPNTATFDNEQASILWSGTEYAPNPNFAWFFDTSVGRQRNDLKDSDIKDNRFYAWAVSPGQITTVPEPQSVALMLAGLSLVAAMRRRHD